ncbi:MAG: sigma-54 dependent transcriptional regulator [Pseudomonadales bacterium]|nr:sigma-54 dependent transcriptional regulator [Pseudomonadales bacterium]
MSEMVGMKILYIEDDEGLWSLVKHALSDEGVELVGAHSLSMALQMADENEYELAIVDYELGDGKGIDFLSEYASKIPSIMLTGVGNEELAVQCMRAGAKDYLVKDLQGRYLQLLPRIIDRAIRESRLEIDNENKERLLNEAKNQLQLVFDSAPDLMVLVDKCLNIVRISDTAALQYNIVVSSYEGRKLEHLLPLKDVNLITSQALSVGECTLRTKINDSHDVLARCQKLTEELFLIVFNNQSAKIAADEAIALAHQAKSENKRLIAYNNELEEILSWKNDSKIVGNSEPIQKLVSNIKSVASTDATVLVFGETGTGKELVADEVHKNSARSNEPLIKLNCAAIPGELIESELFGHIKGAFTGAQKDRPGKFDLADKGTLFLDEIAELDIKVQTKLLRALQEGEVLPVGGNHPKIVDVRVVAATNQNLPKMVADGTFRADLYYRLNVVPLYVPPLRDRAGDIVILANVFFRKFVQRYNSNDRQLLSKDLERLTSHTWPGNVRELQNTIERYVVLGTLDLNEPVKEIERLEPEPVPSVEGEGQRTLQEAERAHILDALEKHNWVIAGPRGAASTLGINPSTLRFRMNKLGIMKSEKAKHQRSG